MSQYAWWYLGQVWPWVVVVLLVVVGLSLYRLI